MDIYRRDFKVPASDVNMDRTMNLSALFTCLQNAAIAHTEALGAGREKTLDRGLFWVVIMQEAHISRMPVYDEELTLLSWPGATMHMLFPRFWQISDRTGSCLVKASSLWGLMGSDSRSLVFPETYDIHVEDMSKGRDIALPMRIKKRDASSLGTFTVPFSYTDLNGHMNNARYLDLAADRMPQHIRGAAPFRLRIEYIEECRYEETLNLSASGDAHSWYFTGETDHPLFRMLVEF